MLALLAPGQGSQTPGMLSPWLELPGADERIASWSEAIGLDLARLGTTATADEITETSVTQPLVVAATLLAHQELTTRGLLAGAQTVVAGHSVGEIAAYAIAGVLSADDAVNLAATRGAGMAKACAVEPTGMAAVLGGDEAEVLARLDALDLVPANRNAAGQIVAAGAISALEKLAEDPPARARVRLLATAGAFHTHFMASALDGYQAAADAATTGEPTATLLSNADGQPVASAADAMEKLVAQLTNPVRWDLCTKTMGERRGRRDHRVPARGDVGGHRQTRTSGCTDVRRQDPRRPGRALRALSQTSPSRRSIGERRCHEKTPKIEGAIVAASQEEIISGLAEIIEEVTGIEPSEVTPEKSFVDDLDIDSLSMVEIAVQTEDKYGVKIPDEDLAGLRTVGDVVAYIQKLEEENPEAAAALRDKFTS